ncbi:MAG: hypothetical protein AB3N11_15320 [Arenibacterium sp.]
MPEIDHLVISAFCAAHGAFSEFAEDSSRDMFDAMFFGPYAIAMAGLRKIGRGGSITSLFGVLSAIPGELLWS